MSPWAEPAVWLAILGAFVVGWLIGFLQATLLRANDQPRRTVRLPEVSSIAVVGAIRRRCEICEDAWAVPAADPHNLELCGECREGLDNAARRKS